MTTQTLYTYNTSWVNDAHPNQLHPGLSESAAIVQKAVDIYKSEKKVEPTNFQSLQDFFETKTNYVQQNNDIIRNQYNNLEGNDEVQIMAFMKLNLGFLRMYMADNISLFISKCLSQKCNFMALTEQMLHVPKTNLSYTTEKADLFDKLIKSIFDLNDFYGIKRRINIINNNKIILQDRQDLQVRNKLNSSEAAEFSIVYANGIHRVAKYGEGIALIIKNDMYQNPVKWTIGVQPANRIEVLNDTKNINECFYYCADIGEILQPFKSFEKTVFLKDNGDYDYGRPIIVAGDFTGTTLKIFVALHNPNIMNLCYIENKNNYTTTEEIKTNIDLRSNKISVKWRTFTEQEKSNIFGKLTQSIGDTISEAFSKTTLKDKPTFVELYLGGDFNDPFGLIFDSIKTKGINFKIMETFFTVKMSTTTNKEILLSCCANRDSQKWKRKKELPVESLISETYADDYQTDADLLKTLGGIDEATFVRVIKGLTEKGKDYKPYPEKFHTEENFGYNGDYVFYLHSNSPQPENNLSLSYNYTVTEIFGESQNIINLMNSDHLPVKCVAKVPVVVPVVVPVSEGGDNDNRGGKRRRTRRRHKSRRKNNKKKSRRYR